MVSYSLNIYLEKEIMVDEMVDFFKKNGFNYDLKSGYGAGGGEEQLKIPLHEAIKKINLFGGGIFISNGNIKPLIFYNKEFGIFSLSMEDYDYLKEGTKELLTSFVKFMLENYPIKKMEEMENLTTRSPLVFEDGVWER